MYCITVFSLKTYVQIWEKIDVNIITHTVIMYLFIDILYFVRPYRSLTLQSLQHKDKLMFFSLYDDYCRRPVLFLKVM
jgi:hypothetical protein